MLVLNLDIQTLHIIHLFNSADVFVELKEFVTRVILGSWHLFFTSQALWTSCSGVVARDQDPYS